MKNILFFIIVFCCPFSSMSQSDSLNLQLRKIKQIQKENETLYKISLDFNKQIDSLSQLAVGDKVQYEVNKAMIAYYVKMNQNIRERMKMMVIFIDELNTIVKKEEK